MKHPFRMFSTLFLCCYFTYSFSQNKLHPLTIGDKVPNIIIGRDINTGKPKKLYDTKKQLILLDFWSAGCGTCIASIPKMDQLQEDFKQKAEIILLTKDDPAYISKKMKLVNKKYPVMPIIKLDTSFAKLFPYFSVPHHVWLDSNYRVRHITVGSNANVKNITDFLAGKEQRFVTKFDYVDFDVSQPLWLEGGGRFFNSLQFYSYLMKRIPGIGSRWGRHIDSTRNVATFRVLNAALLTMIKLAFEEYPGITFEHNNRLIFEVKDSSVFFPPNESNERDLWANKHHYCYEISVPLSRKNDLFKLMRQDMLRYFDYDISVEKRKIPCLALVRTSSIDKLSSKGQYWKPRVMKDTVFYNNMPFSNLVESLNNMAKKLPTPVVDETSYSGNIDICFPSNNIIDEKLRMELQKYDLDLILKDCWIDMLLIRDKQLIKSSSN